MSNINTAAVSGNLTADPEIKMAGSDGDFAIVNLRLANNRSKKQDDGSYADEVSYFDVTVFGKFGELVNRKCRKGDPVSVQGRLEQQRWTNDAGENRSKVVIIAQTIDSPAFFKKDEDVAAKTESGSSTTAAPAAEAKPAPADDDIPF